APGERPAGRGRPRRAARARSPRRGRPRPRRRSARDSQRRGARRGRAEKARTRARVSGEIGHVSPRFLVLLALTAPVIARADELVIVEPSAPEERERV